MPSSRYDAAGCGAGTGVSVSAPRNQTPQADRRGVDDAERREREAERQKHAGDAAAEPQREPAAADRDDDAQRRADQRPAEPARALRGEIERKPVPKKP